MGIDDTLLIGGGWTFAGAQETATAATLTFSGASGIHKLTFGGNYLGGAFSAQSLAGGDLKVGFSFLS